MYSQIYIIIYYQYQDVRQRHHLGEQNCKEEGWGLWWRREDPTDDFDEEQAI